VSGLLSGSGYARPPNKTYESGDMNNTPLTDIAPDIFRKRLLIEGYFGVEVTEETLKSYFSQITSELGLRTYAEPVIHYTSGKGKTVNEGLDGFVNFD
jgi:hypothetical protein